MTRELFYVPVDPKVLRSERQKARDLRRTQWWKKILDHGQCYYCQQRFMPEDLTMDHILPLGRGGRSIRGNTVAACKPCNTKKAHRIPAEDLLRGLSF